MKFKKQMLQFIKLSYKSFQKIRENTYRKKEIYTLILNTIIQYIIYNYMNNP